MAIACYAHPNVPTVAQCADCTRGLCSACEQLFRPALCTEHARLRGEAAIGVVHRRAVTFAIWAALGWILGTWLMTLHAPSSIGPVRLHPIVGPAYARIWFPLLVAYVLGGRVYGAAAMRGRRHGGGARFVMTLDLAVELGLLGFLASFVVGIVATPFVMLADSRLVARQRALVHRAVHAHDPPEAAKILTTEVR